MKSSNNNTTPPRSKAQRRERINLLGMLKGETTGNAKGGKTPPPSGGGFHPMAYLLFIAIGIALIYGYFALGTNTVINDKLGLNEVRARYASGIYSEITVTDRTLEAKHKHAKEQLLAGRVVKQEEIDKVLLPLTDGITDLGFNDPKNPTKVVIKENVWGNFLSDFLPSLLMVLVVFVLAIFFFARMNGGAAGPMAFIRSRARVYDPNNTKDKVVFADVAGAAEEKEELSEVVDFLKNPKKYQSLGAKIPRGVLMVGPPGTGKTLLARAVAGEAGVPFFSISGSEFVEMFVGVGAARVRDLFREAKERAPAIIFIDEIDAIGKRRSPGVGGGHDEREQTLNQILTEMDGFEGGTSVIVLAATNRVDVLDKALLRPGRFDRKVTINLPNLSDREAILAVHTKNKPMDEDVNLKKIASSTVGMSGADLANLINEAAILAGREGGKTITQKILQTSIEKILMGNTKKSMTMTPEEVRLTAYHEVGHALVGHMLPNTDPVHKLSILSRGRALGVTWFLPERDTVLISKAKFIDELATLFGGRAAEEIFFGIDNITTGASNDIERATEMARSMVTRYGFDAQLGPENLVVESFFAAENTEPRTVSDRTQEMIDEKVRAILKQAYETAKGLITQHKDLHIRIAEELLAKEEILRDDFAAFFEGIPNVPARATL